ncbi:glyceraldehyde 3-phosphate dehydrogenase (phosphorylating) [Pancytospora philotis]|nr:glyceraldehyde 3-phosphate dehydrogenase (phosphorylating) [Pancytospora philotis]
MKVGINGFGRIGKNVYKILVQNNIEVPLVNDPAMDLSYMEYLLKYDSVNGRFACALENDAVVCNGIRTRLSRKYDQADIDWAGHGVDYVVEASGVFTTAEECAKHNCKRVILTAPSKDMPMYVYGVNHTSIGSEKVISAASCTTNCLAPLAKLINDAYGIEEAMMSTVHSVTASQRVTDAKGAKWRSARSADNIIPASTGAADAVVKVLPELAGKLGAMAFRVPVLNVSVVDFVVKLKKATSLDAIKALIKEHSMDGVLGWTEDAVVSADLINDRRSSIVDMSASMELNSTFFKLISWYDNEYGYSCRVCDLLKYIDNIK